MTQATQSITGVTNGLVNYWPITGASANDIVGGQHMSPASGATYATDRHGNSNGAININTIANVNMYYWTLPPVSFITGDLTMAMWIKKRACASWVPTGNTFFNYSHIRVYACFKLICVSCLS